jgi:peptide/nickel transport system permease protein
MTAASVRAVAPGRSAGRRALGWARRLAGFALVLVLTFGGLLAVTFFIGRVMPVDPVLAVVGDRASEDVVARVREEMGLNQPLYLQFGRYVQRAVQGDFGNSVLTTNPCLLYTSDAADDM